MAYRKTKAPRRTASDRAPSHVSPPGRANLCQEARARAPRSSQAVFEPTASRPNPIDLLERQARSRVPELVPIRYGRMLVSPFAFFRGAALVMASDLATTPRSGLEAQICGDAYVGNFGVFASPERSLMFDVNDFDETRPGPWEWDVKRLATSVVVAGRDSGLSKKERARAAVASYLGTGTTFDNAIGEFAQIYADQNQQGYEALQQAIASGRVVAETGLQP